MDFLANQVLYFPFSTETMESYMANNKTPALIKYPIHNSIKSLCWHNQQRGTLMNTQMSPNPKCTTQHSPHRGLLFVKCAQHVFFLLPGIVFTNFIISKVLFVGQDTLCSKGRLARSLGILAQRSSSSASTAQEITCPPPMGKALSTGKVLTVSRCSTLGWWVSTLMSLQKWYLI